MISSPTGVSDLISFRRAIEQLELQFVLEPRHALGKTGLRHAERVRGPGEAAVLADGDHLSEASNVQAHGSRAPPSPRRSPPMAAFAPPGSRQGRSSTAGLSRNRPSIGFATRRRMFLTAEIELAADRSADARSRLDLRALGRDVRHAGAGGRRMGTGAPSHRFPRTPADRPPCRAPRSTITLATGRGARERREEARRGRGALGPPASRRGAPQREKPACGDRCPQRPRARPGRGGARRRGWASGGGDSSFLRGRATIARPGGRRTRRGMGVTGSTSHPVFLAPYSRPPNSLASPSGRAFLSRQPANASLGVHRPTGRETSRRRSKKAVDKTRFSVHVRAGRSCRARAFGPWLLAARRVCG